MQLQQSDDCLLVDTFCVEQFSAIADTRTLVQLLFLQVQSYLVTTPRQCEVCDQAMRTAVANQGAEYHHTSALKWHVRQELLHTLAAVRGHV